MNTRFYRPSLMDRIGDSYYPEGIPEDPNVPSYVSEYIDLEGKQFSLVYTHEQLDRHVEMHGGWFHPYIPLGIYT